MYQVTQNVVVFRYIVSSKVVERFWSFCDMPQGDAETDENYETGIIDRCYLYPSCINEIPL